MNGRSRSIGIISDTHGLLRPGALATLQGCQQILHAGDVGKPEILDRLEKIAPVTAVRGNVDRGEWAQCLPASVVVQAGDSLIFMLHNMDDIDIDPAAAGFQVVISGHSHRANAEWRDGVLFLNPGSAGPARFALPVSLAILTVGEGRPEAHILEIDRT